jgi:hypothetical protein
MPQTIIPQSVHPNYMAMAASWEKFRYTMDGGEPYIEKYMVTFSSREDPNDFLNRKSISPIPGFASSALTDVKNAIFQRTEDIQRLDGSKNYQAVVKGLLGGVDLQESTMNHFIGRKILPELIFLGKVGVYIDMPVIEEGQTQADIAQIHPYLYTYKAEQIRNWVYTPTKEGKEFDKLLLEETHLEFNNFGLPEKEKQRFRLLERVDGVVTVKFYNNSNQQIDIDGNLTDDFTIIKMDKIPFVLLELEQSMLTDIANHQIALMNLESADVAYALRANFPFYVEQNSGKFNSTHLQGNENSDDHDGQDIDVGAIQGRQYGKGLERPAFIHPSSEPLEASMEKQKNLKDDIRALVNLALSAVRPKFSSAESKQYDERGLESGLAFLGLILEQAERQIAVIFSAYENSSELITIHYPERYSLKTDLDRLKEADAYAEQMAAVPSKTYQKAIAKEIANVLLGTRISNDDLIKVMKEIDEAKWLSSSAKDIHADIEHGILSLETGAVARGYESDEPVKAATDHAERIARIKEAQSAPDARGDIDNSDNPGEGARIEKDISQDADLQDDGSKAVRGEA